MYLKYHLIKRLDMSKKIIKYALLILVFGVSVLIWKRFGFEYAVLVGLAMNYTKDD